MMTANMNMNVNGPTPGFQPIQHNSSREHADSCNGDAYLQSNAWGGSYGVSPTDVYKKSTPGSAVWFGTKNVFAQKGCDGQQGILGQASQSGYRPSATDNSIFGYNHRGFRDHRRVRIMF